MIIVRFRGGMGNQMFQYAFLRYLEMKGATLKADLSEFKCMKTHAGYELDKAFDLHPAEASYKEIRAVADYIPVMHRFPFSRKVFEMLYKKETKRVEAEGPKKSHISEEKYFDMSEDERLHLASSSEDLYMDGFWIKPDMYDDEVLKCFTFSKILDEKYKGTIEDEHSCSVHVRCGDYTGTGLDILGKEYYEKAAEKILSEDADVKFYVFSDDREKAEKLLSPFMKKIVFCDTPASHAYDDMYLMSRCRHHIIANSTFSFWGARLSADKSGITICPKYEDKNNTANRLVHEGWQML